MFARKHLRDLAFACGLFALLILFYWPVTMGSGTMVPADILTTRQPWLDPEATVPHNGLVADLVFENYVWKQFIIESLQARELPLWNPYVLSGVPFLAAGQHSALYPFSLIFYIFPLARAYGLFTVSQLLVAGLSLYFYARTIKLSRVAAAAGGLVFALSGFFLVSAVFPMIIAVAAWLPFTLAVTERMLDASVGEARSWRERLTAPLPWLILGSLSLGLQFLAGHVEIFYYNLLVLGAYVLWRAIGELRRRRQALALFAGACALMVALGAGLGAVQVLPLYEHVSTNFRQDSATYEQIVGWAYPPRHLAAFAIPDVFGNPTHHSYVDFWSGETVSELTNAQGGRIGEIFWGIKNYVEGGVYISLLGMLLALVGALKRPRRQAWFFIALGLFSLTLVFGLPTYRLVFALPGINQLHSPFRWVFPYSACVAVLAAMGVEVLARERSRLVTGLGLAALAGAGLTVAGLAAARCIPERILPLADRAVASLALAGNAFADGRAFFSYQARNLLLFAACLAGAGVALLAMRWADNAGRKASSVRVVTHHVSRLTSYAPHLVLLAVLALDPWLWFHDFMPAADPAPLAEKPEVVRFLEQQPGPYRIVAYDTQDRKPLPPNTNMLFGLSSVSGYDSIIPRWYAEVMSLIERQELEYNQISRLTKPESLDSPILDLLSVRYVLSEEEIERPGYTLVHDGALRVYRNEDALPRAFVTFQARVFADRQDLLEAMRSFDPRQAVLLEAPAGWQDPATPPEAPAVEFIEDSPNQVRLHVDMPAPGFLVLADTWAPGWVAYTRPGAPSDDQSGEQALTVLRADGAVRAVQLPAGPQTVRFKYSPGSVKTGAFVSFMAGVSLLLLTGAWLWARSYRPGGEEETTRRVAKNTVVPMVLQLLNKGVDMVFAMLMLRLLGPDGAGKYYFAIQVYVILEILTNFGLNTLLTREVARSRERANSYLWNTSILRLGLALVAAPLLLLFLVAYPMAHDTRLAIVLLAIGLLPASISAGLSAVFMAFEVMVIPAVVTTVTTLLKVGLGAAVLLLGWGFVGLAGVSIVVNTVTMAILLALVAVLFFRPHAEPSQDVQRGMLVEASPLMVNHLLAALFFKVDVFLLERMWGSMVLGWYSVSYKLVDAVGIIPPTFTMAIFPLMSRYASSSRESLYKAYLLSIKLLLAAALLIALAATALAYPLASLLGGSAYLPHSAIALEIIVWYMPLGFINSVTQYVLIALNQQRFLTRAFAAGLACGLLANLLVIPRYGYQGAAAVHIVSELALLIPFYIGVRRYLAPVPWLGLLWRPFAAAGAGGALLWLLRAQSPFAAALLAGCVYLGLLFLLGTFDAADRALLRQVVPVERLLSRLRIRTT